MIADHDRAILLVDLPDQQLRAGDVGVVVYAYADGAAYEIEFFTLDGQTIDVVTIEADQIRPVSRRDVLHARELQMQTTHDE